MRPVRQQNTRISNSAVANRTSGAGAGAGALAAAAAAPPTLLFWRSDLNDGRSPRGEALPLDGDAFSLLDMGGVWAVHCPEIVESEIHRYAAPKGEFE
jgi:hypothetical protein